MALNFIEDNLPAGEEGIYAVVNNAGVRKKYYQCSPLMVTMHCLDADDVDLFILIFYAVVNNTGVRKRMAIIKCAGEFDSFHHFRKLMMICLPFMVMFCCRHFWNGDDDLFAFFGEGEGDDYSFFSNSGMCLWRV